MVFFIAEAGVNHNGDIELAKKLIDAAVEAGCDAVKFQTFKTEHIVTKTARKADYQIANTGNKESQYEMVKKLELDKNAHKILIDYCSLKGIKFMSTPFDYESADLLENLGVDIYKIPSGEITNKPFVKYIASKNKPIIMSTGMATLGEVEEALQWVYEENNKEVTLLHCTSNYPTEFSDVNLRAMHTLKEAFKLEVGYSDHTIGFEVPLAAVALGATVIEKHITLDRKMEGPDHKASIEPDQLKQLVGMIRNIEMAMGDGQKRPSLSEKEIIKVARRSIVAKKHIHKGDVISADMLAIKRPGTGIGPKYIDFIIGKVTKTDIKEDELIKLENLNT